MKQENILILAGVLVLGGLGIAYLIQQNNAEKKQQQTQTQQSENTPFGGGVSIFEQGGSSGLQNIQNTFQSLFDNSVAGNFISNII